MILKEKRIARENIFSGNVFNVYKDTVEFENGEQAPREFVEHFGGVGVLALTDDNHILMVRQYRYGADAELLELPAGKLEKGEDPKECGIRELKEETGFTPENFEYLTEMFATPAFCSEKLTIFTASGLTAGQQQLDYGEYLNVEKIPFNKAVEMCTDGRISDAKTIVGVLTYAKKNS